MEIRCPKCRERCEIDFEPVMGQHIICPFCGVKFSYGETTEGKSVSAISQLDPKLLARILFMGGAAIAVVSIVLVWSWTLLFGAFVLIVGALAPKFGATSDMKHMARYMATCAALAIVVGGGCYGMRQNAIRKDQRAVAVKKEECRFVRSGVINALFWL